MKPHKNVALRSDMPVKLAQVEGVGVTTMPAVNLHVDSFA
jgi:hypothetical protein